MEESQALRKKAADEAEMRRRLQTINFLRVMKLRWEVTHMASRGEGEK